MNKPLEERLAKEVTWIPLKDIMPSRGRDGTRGEDTYEQRKENIKEIGLIENPRVFSLGKGKHEVYIGDHRIQMVKELHAEGFWEDKIECYVDNVTLGEAWERGYADNACRANYTSVQNENQAFVGWTSGRYKSYAALGKVMNGQSGQWIGRLLKSRQIRDEVKAKSGVTFDDVGTEVILATRPLKNKNDVVKLLKLVQKKKISAKKTERIAKLCQSNKILNRMILHEGIPYNQVIAEFQNKISKETKKKKTKTITIDSPQLSRDIYKTASRNIDTYLLTLEDGKSKKTAISYLKMTVAVISEALYHYGIINEEQFKQIRDDILEVYMDSLKDYNGESLDNNIGNWVNKSSQDDSEKEQEIKKNEI